MRKNKLRSHIRIARGAASHRRGWRAEWWALLYLLCKGYFPCAMRFRTPKGEVDLVVRRGNLFVAVEVKARPTAMLGHEAMNPYEWQRRAAAMADFMRRHHAKNKNAAVRFDLVVVNPYFQTQHLESAWQPEFSAF
jgi:putative endonuclease